MQSSSLWEVVSATEEVYITQGFILWMLFFSGRNNLPYSIIANCIQEHVCLIES